MNNNTPTVRVTDRKNDTFAAATVGFLPSNAFAAQREAFRAARCTWDGGSRSWSGSTTKLPALVAALQGAGFEVVVPDSLLGSALLEESAPAPAPVAPAGITLFPHQLTGIEWLRARGTRGGLLGDDMGLGKTAQILLSLPVATPVLVVCPAVAKGVWVRETAKFTPGRTAAALEGRGSFRWPAAGEVLAVNFDILPKSEKDARGFGKLSADLAATIPAGLVVVVDEAHKVKNSKAQRTQALRAIGFAARDAGGYVVPATGTPLLNSPPETWAILVAANLQREAFPEGYEFAMRLGGGYLGKYGWEFTARTGEVEGPDDAAISPEFARRLGRVMLRRRKDEVLSLPPKIREILKVEVKGALGEADRVLLKIRESGKSVGDFGFNEISKARAVLARAKIPAALAIAEDCEEQNVPALFMSAHLEPVLAIAERAGWAKITGEESTDERSKIEADFQAGKLRGVACTIRAAGVALTLTRARRVVFVDQDWTPANNEQAEDRAYRIGQTASVLVTVLVAEHPLDDMIAGALAFKGAVVEATIEAARHETITPAPVVAPKVDVAALRTETVEIEDDFADLPF